MNLDQMFDDNCKLLLFFLGINIMLWLYRRGIKVYMVNILRKRKINFCGFIQS